MCLVFRTHLTPPPPPSTTKCRPQSISGTTNLPKGIRFEEQLFALPNPKALDLGSPGATEEADDAESLARHRIDSLEHAANQAFRLEHDAEILGISVFGQPEGKLLRVKMVVEIGKDGRLQILHLVDGFQNVEGESGPSRWLFGGGDELPPSRRRARLERLQRQKLLLEMFLAARRHGRRGGSVGEMRVTRRAMMRSEMRRRNAELGGRRLTRRVDDGVDGVIIRRQRTHSKLFATPAMLIVAVVVVGKSGSTLALVWKQGEKIGVIRGSTCVRACVRG